MNSAKTLKKKLGHGWAPKGHLQSKLKPVGKLLVIIFPFSGTGTSVPDSSKIHSKVQQKQYQTLIFSLLTLYDHLGLHTA